MRNPASPAILAHPAYRPDIDGLRAIAVLSVLAFHAFPRLLPGGFIGVDVFFVISGYLISTILFDNLAKGSFSFAQFYVRRIRRIFPALLLVLAACLVASWFLLLADDYRALGRHVVAGAAFISNLLLWRESGYFDQAASLKPLLHLWSLGIEEQFYLLWPLTLWLAWRARSRPLWVVLLCLAASFAWSLWLTQADAVAAFYSPLARLWELLVGAALAAARSGGPSGTSGRGRAELLADPRVRHFTSLAGAILLGVGLFGLDPSQPFPGWRALLPVLGAAALIAAGPDAFANRRVLARRAMVVVGLISYPLYLWHWPLLAYLNIHYAGVPPVSARVAALCAAFALAAVTYQWVEKPLRFGRRPHRKVAALATAMTAVAGLAMVVIANDGFASRFPDPVARYADYQYDFRKDARVGTCWLRNRQPIDGYAKECIDQGTAPLLVIWGDSHAARLYPGLRAVFGKRMRLAQFTRNACLPFMDAAWRSCVNNNAYVVQQIARLKPAEVLLFAFWNQKNPPPASVVRRIEATIGLLQDAGAHDIVVLGPAAQWREKLPQNLLRLYHAAAYRQAPVRTRFGLEPSAAILDRSLATALAGRPGVRYFSTYGALCDAAGCLTRIGNDPQALTTWDYGHLTTPGATYVARRLDSSMALPRDAAHVVGHARAAATAN